MDVLKIKLALTTAVLIASVGSAHAESKYIKDSWNVGLRTEANGGGNSLGLISSGTKLEVLGAQGAYSQVKTSTGEIGWTKTTYLVSEPTNDIKLKLAQHTITNLNDKIQMLSEDNVSIELAGKLEQAQADNKKLHEEYSQQKQLLAQLQAKLDPEKEKKNRKETLIRILTISLAALLCGFILGKRMIEAKVRARFNGRKVW